MTDLHAIAPTCPIALTETKEQAITVIHRYLQALYQPNDVVELRVLNVDGKRNTASGYYNDLKRLAIDVIKYDGRGSVYATINPVLPDCLARRNNRVKEYAKETTTDDQVISRRHLLLDFDPKRIAGVSSTDAEHQRAYERALACREWLATEHQWPAPFFADSGNGYHLMYEIDLANTPENRALVESVLYAAADKFSDDVVDVDKSVSNAARICKVWGTTAIKGEDIAERPHRVSFVIDLPEPELQRVVMLEQLQAVAALYTSDTKLLNKTIKPALPLKTAPSRASNDHTAFDLQGFIDQHGICVSDIKQEAEGTRYELEQCPFNASHGPNESSLFLFTSGAIGFQCFHNSCTDKTWREVRELYDPACYDRAVVNARYAAQTPNVSDRELAEYGLTDTDNAKRLVTRYGHLVRYCATWKKWLVYDGKRWNIDRKSTIMELAKATAILIFSEAAALPVEKDDDDKDKNEAKRMALKSWAGSTKSRAALNSMVVLAQSDRLVAITPDELDSDSWLLNVQNGTLDLRSGRLLEHKAEDLITKLAPVTFDPQATAPTFDAFMERILPSEGLRRYMQRFFGYALTGSTQEHIALFAYGSGSNGKSTLLELIKDMLGDYAATLSSDVLMVNTRLNVGSEIANLHGRRFCTITELEQGKRLNESLFKDLVSGDKISARRLYEEPFDFAGSHKLIMAGNHKPVIRNNDLGIWRRQRLVPFTVTISPEEKDAALPMKLRTEFPGVLAWAVRGCLEWQDKGMGTCSEVDDATADYRAESDGVGQFLADCCSTSNKNALIGVRQLYKTYQTWCAETGEYYLKEKEFKSRLKSAGFVAEEARAGTVWRGIELRAVADSEEFRPLPSAPIEQELSDESSWQDPAETNPLEIG